MFWVLCGPYNIDLARHEVRDGAYYLEQRVFTGYLLHAYALGCPWFDSQLGLCLSRNCTWQHQRSKQLGGKNQRALQNLCSAIKSVKCRVSDDYLAVSSIDAPNHWFVCLKRRVRVESNTLKLSDWARGLLIQFISPPERIRILHRNSVTQFCFGPWNFGRLPERGVP